MDKTHLILFPFFPDPRPSLRPRSRGQLHPGRQQHGARHLAAAQLPAGRRQGGEWAQGGRRELPVEELDAAVDDVLAGIINAKNSIFRLSK